VPSGACLSVKRVSTGTVMAAKVRQEVSKKDPVDETVDADLNELK